MVRSRTLPPGGNARADATQQRRSGATPRRLRSLGWLLIALGLLLAAVYVSAPAADAQGTPVISSDDIIVADLDGTFAITFSLDSTSPITGASFSVTYDPSLIEPVLNTDPFSGTVGAPTCTRLNGGSGACGPINPTNTVNVTLFQIGGSWQGDVDLVEVEFRGRGAPGVSPLTIEVTEVLDQNSLTISGSGRDGSVTLGADAPTATVTPIPASADLVIAKSAAVSGPVLPGSTVGYTITGANIGPETATDIVVTDTLPEGMSFVTTPIGAGWECSTSGQAFSCTRPSLSNGQSFVFNYDAEVGDNVERGALLTNVAEVDASSTDPSPSSNSADAPITIAPAADPTPGPGTPTVTPAAPTTTPASGPSSTPGPTPTTGPTSTPAPTSTTAPTSTPASPSSNPTTVPSRPRTPPLAYPGPFTNAPPSGAFGDGFIVPLAPTPTPTIAPTAGQASGGQSTEQTGTTLATTGAETPLLAAASFAFLGLGGLLLVASRREQNHHR